MKRRRLRQTSAIFLSLLLCLSLLPIGALAYDYHEPDNWTVLTIGQTEIQEDQYYLINESGSITTDGASAENYNIFYTNNTLTLNNATLMSGIYAPGGTTIHLLGKNVSGSEDKNVTIGIQTFSGGSITITGTGSYDVYTGYEGIATVYADSTDPESKSDIIIESGTLNMHGAPISTRYGGLTITGSAEVTAGAISTGGNPNPDNGGDAAQIARDIIINGNAKVTADSISNLQTIKIGENAVVNVTNDRGIAISGNRGIEISGNATVNATGYGSGLNAFNGSISIGGRVTATNTKAIDPVKGGNAAVSTGGSITVTGNLTVSSTYAGMWTTGTGDIIIDGGAVEMENVPFGLLTRMGGASSGGDISLTNGARVTITGAAMGTYPQGASTLTVDGSTVEIEATDWGLYWPGPVVLKNSTVICTTNNKAIGTNQAISYQYPGGYVFLAGDTADASQEIGQSEQSGHLQDKYVKIEPVTYPSVPGYPPVIGGTENGTVTVTPQIPVQGQKVSITPDPDEGYVVGEVVVTDQNGKAVAVTDNGDGTYTYVQPAGKVTITVTYVCDGTHTCPSLAYSDLDVTKWYHLSTDYVISNGMMNGMGDGLFAPGSNLTRGMIAQVFYNLAGKPVVSGESPFGDVEAGQWYADAVNWAAANGIVEGYGNGKFGPKDDITREQMAQILYNYAVFKGYDVSTQGDLSAFNDGEKTSDWALPAMQWAVGTGLMQGYDGNLNPTGTATRAEVAEMLTNFCLKILKK